MEGEMLTDTVSSCHVRAAIVPTHVTKVTGCVAMVTGGVAMVTRGVSKVGVAKGGVDEEDSFPTGSESGIPYSKLYWRSPR